MSKTTKKTTKPQPTKVPQPGGRGALNSGGTPGNKGGGRPPDEFKAMMQELASSDEAIAYLRECVNGEHGAKPAVAAHKHLTERGYGKVPSIIEGNPDAPLAIRIIEEVIGVDGTDG